MELGLALPGHFKSKKYEILLFLTVNSYLEIEVL